MKYLVVFILFGCFKISAQTNIQITDSDFNQSNPLNCAAIVPTTNPPTNFTDGLGNYGPNSNETLVLCPDPSQANKVAIAFSNTNGFQFNIHPTDSLLIYDGPSTNAPLIGAYNSGTNPNGFYVSASFTNNPSGCLTVKFISDASDESSGWKANLSCGNLPQPFTPHIEAFKNGIGANILNPLDTGFIDLCFGDSVLLVAKPEFPHAFENTGMGYSQNGTNSEFTWKIGGITYPKNDSIWFSPPKRAGYLVDLKITDIFPQSTYLSCKVRVSQQPSFNSLGPLNDSICLGESAFILGGVTSIDTAGVQIPEGVYQSGGVYSELTPLPDGAGLQYQSSIDISGYDTSATVTSLTSITGLCLSIEHSYIGDIEITLSCPNGTTVSLLNAFDDPFISWNQLVPGGCGSDIETTLGNDNEIDGSSPGNTFWTYCFSASNATLGTICNEEALGNTIPNDYIDIFGDPVMAMDTNGVYLPDGNFNAFIGCPINGQWTITVQDNQSQDDGYIFQWEINFNSSLLPQSEGYQNIISSDYWNNDPSIISGLTDTIITVKPSTIGTNNYTFNVIDDFGCHYDTTVIVNVIPTSKIDIDSIGCYYQYQIQGTSSFNGGKWFAVDTCIHFSNANTNNPMITSSTAGIFKVNFSDNFCKDTLSALIEFPPFVYTQILDSVLCQGTSYKYNPLITNSNPLQSGYNPIINLVWDDGSIDPNRIVNLSGNYILTVSNVCYNYSDTSKINVKSCDIEAPNILVLSSTSGNNKFFVSQNSIEKFHCLIINRWGETVYEYTDPMGSWDGYSIEGNLMHEGTYFYKIDATYSSGEEVIKQGFVVLKY